MTKATLMTSTPPTSALSVVEVPGWPPPRGYANGMIAAAGARSLHVAGQIAWLPDGTFPSDDPITQFGIALDNVLAVVAAAGGGPTDVASMTVFVTDIDSYRSRARELGPIWRARLGKHYPAMALVAVPALVERAAKVEIQAVAYLQPAPAAPGATP